MWELEQLSEYTILYVCLGERVIIYWDFHKSFSPLQNQMGICVVPKVVQSRMTNSIINLAQLSSRLYRGDLPGLVSEVITYILASMFS